MAKSGDDELAVKMGIVTRKEEAEMAKQAEEESTIKGVKVKFPTLMKFTEYSRNEPGGPHGAAPRYDDDFMAELIRSYVKDGADVFETDDRGNSIAMVATPGFYGDDQGNMDVVYELAEVLSSDDFDKLLEMKNEEGKSFRDLMLKSEMSGYYENPEKLDEFIGRLKKASRKMKGGKRRRVSKKKTPKRKTSKRKTSKKKTSKRKTSKKKTSKK